MEEKTWQSHSVLWIQVTLTIGGAVWLFLLGFCYTAFLLPIALQTSARVG